MRWRWMCAAAAAIGVAGCWAMTRPDRVALAVDAMRRAERFELISLEPLPLSTTAPTAATFGHGQVLGRTTITDRAVRERLTEALRTGAFQEGPVVACIFVPRHAIRLTRGDETWDVLLCFQCGQGRLDRPGGGGGYFSISRDLRATFDQPLRDAGVPLAPAE